jgi:hypothetical protein
MPHCTTKCLLTYARIRNGTVTIVADQKKDVLGLESQGLDHEQVRSPDGIRVVGEEGAPAAGHAPGIEFRALDAYDLRAVLDVGRSFTAVYMDLSGLSGYRGLLDLVALLNAYATVFTPHQIVVKSGALKHFAMQCKAWSEKEARC